jgi:hypothetical protein
MSFDARPTLNYPSLKKYLSRHPATYDVNVMGSHPLISSPNHRLSKYSMTKKGKRSNWLIRPILKSMVSAIYMMLRNTNNILLLILIVLAFLVQWNLHHKYFPTCIATMVPLPTTAQFIYFLKQYLVLNADGNVILLKSSLYKIIKDMQKWTWSAWS